MKNNLHSIGIAVFIAAFGLGMFYAGKSADKGVAPKPDQAFLDSIYVEAWNAGACAGLKMTNYLLLPKEKQHELIDSWLDADLKSFKNNQ